MNKKQSQLYKIVLIGRTLKGWHRLFSFFFLGQDVRESVLPLFSWFSNANLASCSVNVCKADESSIGAFESCVVESFSFKDHVYGLNERTVFALRAHGSQI